MANITTRLGKGTALSNAEVDANFTNLNSDVVVILPSLAAPLGAALVGANAYQTQDQVNLERVSVKKFPQTQAGYESAVAFAYSVGSELYWPAGNYVSTASIPYFHDVTHVGKGMVLRDGETFAVDLRGKTVKLNRLYVSVPGGGDGLSVAQPMTLNAATLALQNFGPFLRGKWRVHLAAGTYPPLGLASRIFGLASSLFVEFVGPNVGGHPNVPTAIIDGAGGNSSLFAARGMGLRLWLQDIWFKNTGGAATSIAEGVVCQWANVHQENCYYGLSSGSHSEIYLSGGAHKFTGAFSGYAIVRSMFITKHSIGYKFDEALGYAVGDTAYLGAQWTSNGTGRGMLAQELASGHVRGVVIDNFSKGIEVVASSRAHVEFCDVRNCGVATEVEPGCNIFDNTNIWNARTALKNSVIHRFIGGVKTNTMSLPMVQQAGFVDAQAVNVTSTALVDVATPYTLDGLDNNPGTMVKLMVQGNLTGTAGTKSLRLVVGTGFVCSMTFAATVTGTFYAELGFVKGVGDTVLPMGFACAGGLSTVAGAAESVAQYAQVARVLDDGVSKAVTLQANITVAGDSIQFGAITCQRAG